MTHLLYLSSVALSITIFQEFAVAAMKAIGSSGVFDRAPILFRSPCYFMDIGDESVEISAVRAVQFFNTVEVTEGVTVDDNVAAAFDLGDLVDGKADRLKQGNGTIQEQGWGQACPDKRDGQDVEDIRILQIAGNLGSNTFMLPLDLTVKADFFSLNLIVKLSLFLLELLGEFLFQFFNGLYQVLQFVVHWGLGVRWVVKREVSVS